MTYHRHITVMTAELLPSNLFWHAMHGPHTQFAVGTSSARRFASGFSALLAFADQQRPDFAAIAPFCAQADEHFYCEGWAGAAPQGWQIEAETRLLQMVWDKGLPSDDDAAPYARLLTQQDVPQMLSLTALTKPGPFGPRTIELGNYYGYFDEAHQLMAMAGERMWVGKLREVSGVCTHPAHQGKGLARKLMLKLIRQEMQRGETPFLHVLKANQAARSLYERMGFRLCRETIARVVSRHSQ